MNAGVRALKGLTLPLLLAAAIGAPGMVTAAVRDQGPVLRVGVLDGAQPCSDAEPGRWSGLAVELWAQVAAREQLPFIHETRRTAADLLRAVRQGELDVGIGCLTITPQRVNSVRFTLPFLEMGLAVLQRRSRLEAGEAMLRSLISRPVLELLGAYLACIAVVSLLLWHCEAHGSSEEHQSQGQRRSFAKVFQILATGPGTNTIAATTRGHGLVIVSYLIRIVTASLLVTTITVKLVREPAGGLTALHRLNDLQGLRVAARPGSVSEEVLQELRNRTTARPLTIVPLTQVNQAPELLLHDRADAVLAEELQMRYALSLAPRGQLGISLQGLLPESQAFVLSPGLDPAIAARINRAISMLKRSGVVSELKAKAMNNS
ncbi:MAG: ligand gated channel (GIC family protein) [Synechococcaceae bacterium WB4_1_0192]|jgi:ABC-type amino acid transport substrate-binding protein|nr:ligand gated channel (GIC family protein) [Synechococcaceae bacterium WB4_1_0192]